MEIQAEQRSEATLVRLSGPLDRSTAARARQQLAPLTASDGPTVVVDLSEIPAVSGAGARVLYDLHVALRRQSRPLLLCAPVPAVAATLAFTGLPRLVPIRARCEDELRGLAS